MAKTVQLHLRSQFHKDVPGTPNATRVGFQQSGKVVKEYIMRHGASTEVPDDHAKLILEQNAHIVEVFDPKEDYSVSESAQSKPAEKSKGKGQVQTKEDLFIPKNIETLGIDGINDTFKRNGWKVPASSVKLVERTKILQKMISIGVDLENTSREDLDHLFKFNGWPVPDKDVPLESRIAVFRKYMAENDYPIQKDTKE